MKDLLIVIVLGLIMVLNTVDVIVDIGLGVPRWHIFEEILIVIASGVAFLYLLWEMRQRKLALRSLAADLSQADLKLQDVTEQMRSARSRYAEVIQQQFTEWTLTRSEQEVAILLLKGLSFKEIAVLRDTREKTVRQQASAIYAKTGLEGRHAFSAFFLEDFLVAEA
jgi:DNA-binding NarL/FixJ family response regulator